MSASDSESLDRSEIYPKNVFLLSGTTTAFAIAGGGEGNSTVARFALLSMTNIRRIIKIWGLLLPTRQIHGPLLHNFAECTVKCLYIPVLDSSLPFANFDPLILKSYSKALQGWNHPQTV
ncbi:hypothetical protein C8R48DRAFT_767458 [Suillus tomentosus]|nr:hypothetical protein C8R48DRAFT_767458 [Suillus tomentosus]